LVCHNSRGTGSLSKCFGFLALYCDIACLNRRKIIEIEPGFCFFIAGGGVSWGCIWGIPISKILLKSFKFFRFKPQLCGKNTQNLSFD